MGDSLARGGTRAGRLERPRSRLAARPGLADTLRLPPQARRSGLPPRVECPSRAPSSRDRVIMVEMVDAALVAASRATAMVLAASATSGRPPGSSSPMLAPDAVSTRLASHWLPVAVPKRPRTNPCPSARVVYATSTGRRSRWRRSSSSRARRWYWSSMSTAAQSGPVSARTARLTSRPGDDRGRCSRRTPHSLSVPG